MAQREECLSRCTVRENFALGKLPFTFPIKLEDSPAYHLGVYPQQQPERPRDVFVDLVNRDKFRAEQKAEADYAEDIFVGYRWYATKNISPLYPFGHGLSYANFQYSALQAKINKSQVDVSFTLDNIGKMNAEEVAQSTSHALNLPSNVRHTS